MESFCDCVSEKDLQKFELIYNEQLKNKNVTTESKFNYACCLVRSKYPADINKGIVLFEQLCKENKRDLRDYLYFLAIGNARLKEYSQALTYCRKFLQAEPMNLQVQQLETHIKTMMDTEGKKGLTITAVFGAVFAAAVVVGVALTKNK